MHPTHEVSCHHLPVPFGYEVFMESRKEKGNRMNGKQEKRENMNPNQNAMGICQRNKKHKHT